MNILNVYLVTLFENKHMTLLMLNLKLANRAFYISIKVSEQTDGRTDLKLFYLKNAEHYSATTISFQFRVHSNK